ncbi:DUF2441 domain-containing protein [Bacillus cereus]|nr:DUF2441 domain-containing protein [Bacillus cereus]
MGNYYHTSNDNLALGTVLQPMYGEKLKDSRRYVNDNVFFYDNYTQYLKEMLFEEIRRTEFPSLPSRIQSIYLTESYEGAIQYADKYTKKYIYEVEIENPSKSTTLDMQWMDLSILQSYDTVKEMARNYYNGKSIEGPFHWGIYEGAKNNPIKIKPFWETLYDGKVIVKKCVLIKEPIS